MKNLKLFALVLGTIFMLVGCDVVEKTEIITITFDVLGGEEISSINFELGSGELVLPTPEREGYTFNNWYINEEYTDLFNVDNFEISEEITLYASWDEIEVLDLTYDVYGETHEVINIYIGETIDFPDDPVMEGYIFVKWCSNEEMTEGIEDTYIPTEDIILYAQFIYDVPEIGAFDTIYENSPSTAYIENVQVVAKYYVMEEETYVVVLTDKKSYFVSMIDIDAEVGDIISFDAILDNYYMPMIESIDNLIIVEESKPVILSIYDGSILDAYDNLNGKPFYIVTEGMNTEIYREDYFNFSDKDAWNLISAYGVIDSILLEGNYSKLGFFVMPLEHGENLEYIGIYDESVYTIEAIAKTDLEKLQMRKEYILNQIENSFYEYGDDFSYEIEEDEFFGSVITFQLHSGYEQYYDEVTGNFRYTDTLVEVPFDVTIKLNDEEISFEANFNFDSQEIYSIKEALELSERVLLDVVIVNSSLGSAIVFDGESFLSIRPSSSGFEELIVGHRYIIEARKTGYSEEFSSFEIFMIVSDLGEATIEYDLSSYTWDTLLDNPDKTAVAVKLNGTIEWGVINGYDELFFIQGDNQIILGYLTDENQTLLESYIGQFIRLDLIVFSYFYINAELGQGYYYVGSVQGIYPDPIFTLLTDQTIEVGSIDIDWTTYIDYIDNDLNETFTSVEFEDNVDYDTLGSYTVTVQVVDEYSNVITNQFNVIVVDTIAPTFDEIIDQTIEAGSTDIDWTSYILNVVDNYDVDLTYLEEDTIDYDTPGTYNLTVSVTDSSGNIGSQVISVTVEDTIVPIFDSIDDQTIEASPDSFDWASLMINITENSDDVLIYSIISNQVDNDTPGTYSVTVKLEDKSGNNSIQTFSVTVVDTTPPTFDLVIDTSIEVLEFTNIDWHGFINPTDNSDGILSCYEVEDNVNYSVIGTYTVTLSLVDESSNETIKEFDIIVEDTTAPIIDLIGDIEIEVVVFDDYLDEGATCSDNYDTSCTIVTVSTVNVDVLGTYTVVYTVVDVSGNETIAERKVHVVDTIAPNLNLVGDLELNLNVFEDYIDAGYICIDNYDAVCDVELTSTLDNQVLGTYSIEFVATDSSGNKTLVTRVIHVLDVVPPIVNTDTNITLTVGFTPIDYELYIHSIDNYYDSLTTTIDSIYDGETLIEEIDNTVYTTYTVNYSVKDGSNNITTGSYCIDVYPIEIPAKLESVSATIVDDYDYQVTDFNIKDFESLSDGTILTLTGFSDATIIAINPESNTSSIFYEINDDVRPLDLIVTDDNHVLIIYESKSTNTIFVTKLDASGNLVQEYEYNGIDDENILSDVAYNYTNEKLYIVGTKDEDKTLYTFTLDTTMTLSNQTTILTDMYAGVYDLVYIGGFVFVQSSDLLIYNSSGGYIGSLDGRFADIEVIDSSIYTLNNQMGLEINKYNMSLQLVDSVSFSNTLHSPALQVISGNLFVSGRDTVEGSYEKGFSNNNTMSIYRFEDGDLSKLSLTTIVSPVSFEIYTYGYNKILGTFFVSAHGEFNENQAFTIYDLSTIIVSDTSKITLQVDSVKGDYSDFDIFNVFEDYQIEEIRDNIDVSVIGEYYVEYITTVDGFAHSYKRPVIVQGIGDSPVITCDANYIYIEDTVESFTLPCTVTDTLDGDLTSSMEISEFQLGEVGIYTVDLYVRNSLYLETIKTITIEVYENESTFIREKSTVSEIGINDYATTPTGIIGTVGKNGNKTAFFVLYDLDNIEIKRVELCSSTNYNHSIAFDGTNFFVIGYMCSDIEGEQFSGNTMAVFDTEGNLVKNHPVYTDVSNIMNYSRIQFINDQLLLRNMDTYTLYSSNYSTSISNTFTGFEVFEIKVVDDGIIFVGCAEENSDILGDFTSSYSEIYRLGVTLKTDFEFNELWIHIMDTTHFAYNYGVEVIDDTVKVYGEIYSAEISFESTFLGTEAYMLSLDIDTGEYMSIVHFNSSGSFGFVDGITLGDQTIALVNDSPDKVYFISYKTIVGELVLPGTGYNNEIKGIELHNNQITLIGSYDNISEFLSITGSKSGGYITTISNLSITESILGMYYRDTFDMSQHITFTHNGSIVDPSITILNEISFDYGSTYTILIEYGDFYIVRDVTVSFLDQ